MALTLKHHFPFSLIGVVIDGNIFRLPSVISPFYTNIHPQQPPNFFPTRFIILQVWAYHEYNMILLRDDFRIGLVNNLRVAVLAFRKWYIY
jgi:hypothetical protein